jgi:hypothetical protein
MVLNGSGQYGRSNVYWVLTQVSFCYCASDKKLIAGNLSEVCGSTVATRYLINVRTSAGRLCLTCRWNIPCDSSHGCSEPQQENLKQKQNKSHNAKWMTVRFTTRPWRPISLWDVKDSRQSAHKWLSTLRIGRALTPEIIFLLLVLISVRGWVNPRA